MKTSAKENNPKKWPVWWKSVILNCVIQHHLLIIHSKEYHLRWVGWCCCIICKMRKLKLDSKGWKLFSTVLWFHKSFICWYTGSNSKIRASPIFCCFLLFLTGVYLVPLLDTEHVICFKALLIYHLIPGFLHGVWHIFDSKWLLK